MRANGMIEAVFSVLFAASVVAAAVYLIGYVADVDPLTYFKLVVLLLLVAGFTGALIAGTVLSFKRPTRYHAFHLIVGSILALMLVVSAKGATSIDPIGLAVSLLLLVAGGVIVALNLLARRRLMRVLAGERPPGRRPSLKSTG
jgi:peptidoglycan/LPS O-acetylase OafA/YrhL